MKLWQTVSATIWALTLVGCAQKEAAPPPMQEPDLAVITANTSGQPTVTGSVYIDQRMALPPDAIVTVTLSDASVSNAPSKVLAQRVARTNGKQSPFRFVLPYNPSDIQPNANIILSAAITNSNGQMMFITDTIKEVINHDKGTQADLKLVPITSVPVATRPMESPPMPSDTPATTPVP